MSNLNVENRTLYHGDNLSFLRNLNSESVNLIATDPPFNKNKDFHATPDSLAAGAKFQDRWSWERDVHQEWVDKIKDDFPKLMEAIESARFAHSDGMGAFMCFMAVRLLEMRRVLKPTGSIYLHCDSTASHYLKAIMDAIFGRKNFKNDITWCYDRWEASSGCFQKMHDNILFYSKNNKSIFNTLTEIDDKRQKTLDRGYTTNLLKDGTRQLIIYEGSENKPNIQKLKQKDKFDNIIIRPKEQLGRPLKDYWYIDFIHPRSKERFGYPTQKPLNLYERIIKASSNEGDVVLDPFAGCATTLVAAERLNRQWIGIDIWEKAHEAVIERLKKDGDIKNNLFEQKSIIYTKELPVRTDDGYDAVPFMKTKLKKKRNPEPWQLLSRKDIVNELIQAQSINDLVICAGCGRELEPEFMELDHIKPKAEGGENDISNRILLCRPCNGKKRDRFTMRGLINDNKKSGWLKDVEKAKIAKELALKKSEEIRYGDD